MQQKIYFVGTDKEVAHHAAPLANHLSYKIVEPASVAGQAKPGDLAIFFSEHFDRFRSAIAELKQNNVATLYMIDGILEWRNAWDNRIDEPACPFTMRPILCHKAACIGNSQARVLGSWGNGGKIEVVGIPRLDDFALSVTRNTNSTPRLLVMTAKCPSYTPDQKQKLSSSLLDLKQHLDGRNDIEVIWRLTAGLDQELGVENSLDDFKGHDLAATLDNVDAVISTPSTAVLESMLKEIPTAVLDYTNSPSYVHPAWKISSRDQIENEVSSLLTAEQTRMFFQNGSLHDALQLDQPATQRMSDLVVKMLDSAHQSISAGKSLEFESSMLSVPASNSKNDFDHARLFSSFEEFQTDDKIELQAQLAHARREISHLQMQLKQLESELGQAHEIFDEINNHPVAGPIVKIRKRILSLMGKIKTSSIQPEPN